ncbi:MULTISPECIES: MarR family transcriptional regulator [Natrialba]|uniref:MarR family transcriptional regulator n=1 Tax=Natrialba swarupiae TaxID=2448032 RepID=A0A5D5AQ76_9EURY|nr:MULTISPECIES: MarR family transcriptional regulator [Natrialba]MCW8172627.1 MarR family transcriptional regulator [Natrialba swarupiae]MWV39478.1 MarR family transcriptional regulator [Natrialba sp. INN-245]TYT63045.1 MarR family transcriptional regulator [Natrialba swarupiae]
MTSTVEQGTDVSVPTDVTTPRAKLVYYYLATKDGATADNLRSDLAISKGNVLSIVGTLRERGHVKRVDGRYELAD